MYFVYLSVSVADLLSHSELDPDSSDGSFTEAEARVKYFFLCFFPSKNTAVIMNPMELSKLKCGYCLWLEQGVLGGVDKVDTAAFESVWNNIKEKYVSEV